MTHTSIDHLAGKRIQVVQRAKSNIFGLRIYSGTHPIFEVRGTWFSLESARKDQKKFSKILGMKATHKIKKVKFKGLD